MISRRNFLGLGAGALGSFFLNPTKAFSWGAFTKIAPTHQIIAKSAYNLVMNDLSNKITMTFPDIQEVLKCDWAFGNWRDGIYGNGPDVAGASPYSWHYYNPKTKKGRGPFAVSKYFQELVQGLRTNPNGPGTARAASWTSHFIADMHVPYHVYGLSIEDAHRRFQSNNFRLSESESGPLYLYQLKQPPVGWGGNRNFYNALEYYCKNYPRYVNGKSNETDWFDPWYFNGVYRGNVITGSHAAWELDAHGLYWNPEKATQMLGDICKDSYYDPWWKNSKGKFGQDFWQPAAQQAAYFADKCAQRTVIYTRALYNSPITGMIWAIRSAATLFRASLSTLSLRVHKENKGNGKFKYTAIATNNHRYATVNNVDARLMVKHNGKWRGTAKKIGSIPYGKEGWVSWNIDTRILKATQAHMDVAGIYPDKNPDLGYVNKFFTIDREQQPEAPQADPIPQTNSCPIPPGAKLEEEPRAKWYSKIVNGKEVTVGPEIQWYDNARTQIKYMSCNNQYGKPHGLKTTFRRDGTIYVQYYFQNGGLKKVIVEAKGSL